MNRCRHQLSDAPTIQHPLRPIIGRLESINDRNESLVYSAWVTVPVIPYMDNGSLDHSQRSAMFGVQLPMVR